MSRRQWMQMYTNIADLIKAGTCIYSKD